MRSLAFRLEDRQLRGERQLARVAGPMIAYALRSRLQEAGAGPLDGPGGAPKPLRHFGEGELPSHELPDEVLLKVPRVLTHRHLLVGGSLRVQTL